MAFEQGGIFIVPHQLRHGASVFPVSSEGPPHSVAFYDTLGDVEDLFYPGPSQVPYQSPFTTHKGMWRTYSNPDEEVSFTYSYLVFKTHWEFFKNNYVTEGGNYSCPKCNVHIKLRRFQLVNILCTNGEL